MDITYLKDGVFCVRYADKTDKRMVKGRERETTEESRGNLGGVANKTF
jgi:hypothetical protein